MSAALSMPTADRPLTADRILDAFAREEHRGSSTWTDHLDINRVALAASLVPGGWFG